MEDKIITCSKCGKDDQLGALSDEWQNLINKDYDVWCFNCQSPSTKTIVGVENGNC